MPGGAVENRLSSLTRGPHERGERRFPEGLRRNRSPGFCSKGSRPAAVALFYAIAWAAIRRLSPGAATSRCAKSAGAGPTRRRPHIWGRRPAADGVRGAVAPHRGAARWPLPEGAHRLIFYGFALLFIGTSIITLQVDVSDALFGWKFWYGDFYLVFSLVLDVAGVALIAGLIYMMVRRGWIRPPKLDYARAGTARPVSPTPTAAFYRREDWAFSVDADHDRHHGLRAGGGAADLVAGSSRRGGRPRMWSPVRRPGRRSA